MEINIQHRIVLYIKGPLGFGKDLYRMMAS